MPHISAPKNRLLEPRDPQRLKVSILNRQRKFSFNLARIRKIIHHAIPLCLAKSGPFPSVLLTLSEVTVSIVSPTTMSRVHFDFLGSPDLTDVITFPYGEIIVCAAIAAENSVRYSTMLDEELALYIIHGLLHLNGFDDLTGASARQMRARQAKILNTTRLVA